MKLKDSIKNFGEALTNDEVTGKSVTDLLRSIGTNLTGVEVKGKLITDILNETAAILKPIVKVAPAPNDVDLLGKYASDLQENIVIGSNAITGTLKYVDNYDGFEAGAKGNFLALYVVPQVEGTTITIEIIGGTSGAVTLDDDGLYVGKIANNQQSIQIVASIGNNSATYNYSLSDLVLTPAPTPPTPSLTPYVNGETIANGDKIYFDTESSIESILSGLTYNEDGAAYLLEQGEDPVLTAQNQEGMLYLELKASENAIIVWSNTAVPEASVVEGWQNLNEDDSVTFALESSITLIVSEQEGWNGFICGKKDEPTPPTPSLTPFSVGDTFADGDKIYVDTSFDVGTFLSGLTYTEGQAILVGAELTTSGGETTDGMLVAAGNMGDLYVLMITKDGDTPHFVWASAENQEMGIVQGWQNLDGDDYVQLAFTGFTSAEVTSLNATEGWNGVLVGTKED